ncbi:MAG: hypothetical protein ACFE0O_06050 [Opitutales bacterium]
MGRIRSADRTAISSPRPDYPLLDGVGILGGLHSSLEWARVDSIPVRAARIAALLADLAGNH